MARQSVLKKDIVSVNEDSRFAYRQSVARVFLTEQAGHGNIRTDYIYFVETDRESGNRVFLKRPATLNKGFDFTIRVEGIKFEHVSKNGKKRHDNIPSHQNIYDDLMGKKQEDIDAFNQIKPLFEKVYQCQPITDEEYAALSFKSGISVELLLKTIKWLFIEQDITYWNWSGREMLYGHLIKCW